MTENKIRFYTLRWLEAYYSEKHSYENLSCALWKRMWFGCGVLWNFPQQSDHRRIERLHNTTARSTAQITGERKTSKIKKPNKKKTNEKNALRIFVCSNWSRWNEWNCLEGTSVGRFRVLSPKRKHSVRFHISSYIRMCHRPCSSIWLLLHYDVQHSLARVWCPCRCQCRVWVTE